MTINNKIRHEKLQYDINREAAKISALSSGKVDKFKYHAGEENYLLVRKEWCSKLSLHIFLSVSFFEKQIKPNEDQGIKKFEALKALKPEENQELESIEGLSPNKMRTNKIKNEIDEIKK